jgi:hypothetical protein
MFGSKKKRARKLIEALSAARESVPIEAIGELIALAREAPPVRTAVAEELERVAAEDGDDIRIASLGLVCGELGREGLLAVVSAVGRCDEGLGDDALVPGLTRGILQVLPDVLREIHLAEDTNRRGYLYEALDGALLLGDERVRDRLRIFARERWEAEKEMADGPELADTPLGLLLCLGDEHVAERLEEGRRLCKRGDLLDCDLNDIECALRGELDLLSRARQIVKEDWRAAAENLDHLMNPSPEDLKRMEALLAELEAKGS